MSGMRCALLVAIGGVLLTSSHAGAQKKSGAELLDGCLLLTQAEASAIVGKPVVAPHPWKLNPRVCSFVPTGASLDDAGLAVSVKIFATKGEFHRLLGACNSKTKFGETIECLGGTGEAALWTPMSGLWVFSGKRAATIGTSNKSWAIAAAKKIAPRL